MPLFITPIQNSSTRCRSSHCDTFFISNHFNLIIFILNMNLKDIVQGYFQKTDEEKREIVLLCTRYYIEDMVLAEGNLYTLKLHLQLLQKRSLEKEDYEVSSVLGEIINGINLSLQDDGV